MVFRKGKNEDREHNQGESKKVVIKGDTSKPIGDVLESAELIKILFGGEKRYEYRLRLTQKLDLPLFRERNFLYFCSY